MTFRLFIAIALPEEHRRALAALPRAIRDARYTKTELLHVTLRFLGDTPEEEVPHLEARLRAIRHAPFPLTVAGLGVFPSSHAPRVLWVGLNPPAPLRQLHRAIKDALQIPSDQQEFTPHITLARLGPRARQDTHAFLAAHGSLQAGSFLADRFHLFRSQLEPSGAVHTKIASFSLA